MGSFVGHVFPGLGFLLVGLWHLFNHLKLHALNPTSYTSLAWFPFSSNKNLELHLIVGGSTLFVVMELIVGPRKHHPFDTDGTIPSNHLHNVDHALIALAFLTYALLSLAIDRAASTKQVAKHALVHLLGAMAFSLELLLFHLHSTDHSSVEGHYHMLLQLLLVVVFVTAVMGIPFPNSFLVSFIRSLFIFSKGVWMVVIGFVLWTPALVAKGCWINDEESHKVVRCDGDASLHRAKALANFLFCFFVMGMAVFAVYAYLWVEKFYSNYGEYNDSDSKNDNGEFYPLIGLGESRDDDDDIDVESSKKARGVMSGTGFDLLPR